MIDTLIGRKIGVLTVLEKMQYKKNENFVYKCRCECGQENCKHIVFVRKGNLTKSSSPTQSCGCNVVIRCRTYVDGTQLEQIKPHKKLQINNTSGTPGVHYNTRFNLWVANIELQGKRLRIGLYKTVRQATAARRKAELLYFKPLYDCYGKSYLEGQIRMG